MSTRIIDNYDVIYLLKLDYEEEPDWWKLKWKPMYRHTYSFYFVKGVHRHSTGIRAYRADAKNGWNRSYKHLVISLFFSKWEVTFWIRWNFIVHKDGPGDIRDKRPLILSGDFGK